MNYDDAMSAVTGAPGVTFASRIAWVATPYANTPYVGDASETLTLYSPGSTATYSPSNADRGATDWFDGPDKPPQKP